MRTYAALFLLIAAAFAVAVLALTGGCVAPKAEIDAGDNSDNEVNALKAEVQAAAFERAKLKAEIASIREMKVTTSQPVVQGDNGTSAQNTNTGWLNLNYAPVTAAGSGVVILGLWLRHIRRMAQIDAENDRHTKETLAGVRKCNAPSPPG